MSDTLAKYDELMNKQRVKPLSTNERILPSMRYDKDQDWDKIRMHIFGMLNAYQPTVIDDYKQVKQQFLQVVETELEEANELYENMKENGLTANSIECEGYIRACKTILEKLESWV